MVKSLDEVIERLQYKADNIKAKLEPSYFTECIDYLKTLPRVQEEQEIRSKAIEHYMSNLLRFCMEQENDCNKTECPFCKDGCEIVNIAEQMKGEQ